MPDYYLTHNLVSTNKQPPNTNTPQQCVLSTPMSSIGHMQCCLPHLCIIPSIIITTTPCLPIFKYSKITFTTQHRCIITFSISIISIVRSSGFKHLCLFVTVSENKSNSNSKTSPHSKIKFELKNIRSDET